MTIEGNCIELSRFKAIEAGHEALHDDVIEIKNGFKDLTKELHNISLDIRGHSEVVTAVLQRMSDKDRAQEAHCMESRETFKRLGSKIDALEERQRISDLEQSQLEVLDTRLSTLEKVVWSIGAGLGALVLFYIQKFIK
jgi:predicted  nucleic acid-binding Zn-ribbon protein